VVVGNQRGDVSRSVLLEAGKAAFSEQRYEEVSIVGLARSIGVAAGSISYHFGGKRGFYLAVIESAAEEFWSDLLAMRGPALDRLICGVDSFLDRAQGQPGAFEALIADVADAEVRRIRDQHRSRLAHALAVEITGTDSTPVLRAAISGCLSFMEGVVLNWLHTNEVTREQVKDLIIANLFATVLSAVRSDPEIELSHRVLDAALSDSPLLSLFLGPNPVPQSVENVE
jgi:AcrR family transcriptional regulator